MKVRGGRPIQTCALIGKPEPSGTRVIGTQGAMLFVAGADLTGDAPARYTADGNLRGNLKTREAL